MENVVFTQLSIPEIRQIFRQELENYFIDKQTAVTNPAEQDELLTIQQAGELINLRVPTIYGLVSRSEIPYSKPGKRLYFSKKELLAWVQSGRKKTNAEIQAEATNYTNGKRK